MSKPHGIISPVLGKQERRVATSLCPVPSSNNNRDVNAFAQRMMLEFPIEALNLSEHVEADRTEQ